MSTQPHVLAYGDVIKFKGGRYNGFEGYVTKIDLTTGVCAVMVDYENKKVELIEHFGFFQLLKPAEANYTHDTSVEDDAPAPEKVSALKRFLLRFRKSSAS